jgi:uncharacterized protein (DUF2141 family)
LFASAVGFPTKPELAIQRTTAVIVAGRATCDFAGVVPGTYAVSVTHDENSDGKLDRTFIGIPREGVGASNNARGSIGPPHFDAAAFHVDQSPVELAVTVTYLN